MKFIPTKQNNPCPICQNTSGDCRLGQNNLVLCHSYIEQDSGIAGYRWTKTSSNGVWGVHARDNAQEFNRQQYELNKQIRQDQKRNQKQFLADNALNADGRDLAIRKLAAKVGLSDRDQQSLSARGLSKAEITDGLFFSIDPWKRFNLDLPENLPGVLGDRFTTRDDGYSCPAFDQHGRVIGWQLRVHGVNEGNKYRWAKSTFSSHLPNAELPVTIVNPVENASKTLYLSEGILKPYVASKRHNLAVCGAAGGHFRGSPEQLTQIVSDYEQLVLVPDAGDALNSHVMRRWSQQIEFLQRFGKTITILWWGQFSKEQFEDFDEIDAATLANAQYLSPTEFYELAKKQRYLQQQWDNWKIYKQFSPQIKIEKKYIEFGLPQSNTIALINSGLGSGKTTELIKNLLSVQNYGIIGLGYRNTLLLQFNEKAKQLGFYHLQSDKNLREFSLDDPGVKVTNCIDSLIHYQPDQFDHKIVVIDEIISVLKHFLFSSTIKQFSQVKQLFTEMVNRCDRLICLDGHLQDWAVQFFQELCPSKQIVTIENTHQGDKAQIYLLEGTVDIDEKIRVNDRTPWVQKLLNSYCPAIASDSQVFCESTENLLLEQGRTGIRIDSKTVSENHVKEFFTNPERYIREHQPEYIIYSPSAESGLDIPTQDYFSEHFCFFFGCLDVDSMIQMLGRVRDTNVPKFVWCKQFIRSEDSIRRPSNVESIQADRARALMSELHSTLNSIESPEIKIAYLQQVYQDNLDPYTTIADTITAIRNHEFSNYRKCLKQQLLNSGYPVEAVTPESISQRKTIAKKEKEAQTEVKQQNSQDIFAASDKYLGQKQIKLDFDANWETRCAVMKAGLVSRLPGINHNRIWSPDFIKQVKYDQPRLIRQCELYHLLENPDLAKQLSIEKYNRIFNQGNIDAPWKLRQDYLKIKALRDVGIYDFIQNILEHPEYVYDEKTPEVRSILQKCQYQKHRQVLGTPGKTPIKFLNNLLRSMGLETKSHQARDENGVRYRCYSIKSESLIGEVRRAILQAIKLKYDQRIDSSNQLLEWQQNATQLPTNPPQECEVQNSAPTIAAHSVDSVTLHPVTSKENTLSSVTPNLSFYPPEPHISDAEATNKIQKSQNLGEVHPLDTEEAIIDLADTLNVVEDEEMLQSIIDTPGMTRVRLNRASRLLSVQQRQNIRQWAITLRPLPNI